MVEWSAVDIVYIDFSKAFDPVSQDAVVSKLRKHSLVVLMEVRCTEKWLNAGSQRAVS